MPGLTTCTQGSQDAWLISLLIYTPIFLVALHFANKGSSEPGRIRLITLPLALLLLWAGYVALKYSVAVSIQGNHLCSVATGIPEFNSYPSAWWAAFWGPIQLALVAAAYLVILRYWRNRTTANNAINPDALTRAGYGRR